jgi:hypothetical protein
VQRIQKSFSITTDNFFQNLQETQLFRTADKDRLRRYILKLLDSRGATLNAPLEEF